MPSLAIIARELASIRSAVSQLFDIVDSLILTLESIPAGEESDDSSDSDYRSHCTSPVALLRQETLGELQIPSPISLSSEYGSEEEDNSAKVYKKLDYEPFPI